MKKHPVPQEVLRYLRLTSKFNEMEERYYEIKKEFDKIKKECEEAKLDALDFMRNQVELPLKFSCEQERREFGDEGTLQYEYKIIPAKATLATCIQQIKTQLARRFNSSLPDIEKIFTDVMEEEKKKNTERDIREDIVRLDVTGQKNNGKKKALGRKRKRIAGDPPLLSGSLAMSSSSSSSGSIASKMIVDKISA